MPPDVGLRFNFKHGALDVDVVSLTCPSWIGI